jgi:hypothetical protein
MTPRLPPFLRSPTFWLLLGVFAAEFWLFDQVGARRHTAVYPRFNDQIQYLTESYAGHEFARSRGVVAGVLNALTKPSAQGALHDAFAIVAFHVAGPSRSTALALNMLALIGWQLALFFAVARTSGSRPLAFASALLPLVLAGPWQNVPGSAFDFRLDHLAMCALGITAATALLTDGFHSRSGSSWFGIAVGLTLLTRFLTGTYFVLIFAGFALWILLTRATAGRDRSLNLLRAAALALVIAGPFFWLNYDTVRDYYWIGHYVGPESAIRSQQFGLLRSVQYVFGQLGERHLGVAFGVLALAGAAALAALRTKVRQPANHDAWPGHFIVTKNASSEISACPPPSSRGKLGRATLLRPAPTKSAQLAPTRRGQGEDYTPARVKSSGWVVGAVFLLAPATVLVLHVQKSEVVISALVPGAVTLAAALWATAAQRTSETARAGLAALAAAVALGLFARQQFTPAFSPAQLADLRQVNTFADRIHARTQALPRRPGEAQPRPRVAVDHITDALDAQVLRVVIYERHRVLVPFEMLLPTGIAEPTEAEVSARLGGSDFVFVTEDDTAGPYPFDRKLAALRPQVRAWCEANLRPAERFTLLGRRMVLYQRRDLPFP